MPPRVPPYFDYLIDAFHCGAVGRFVHLGYWDDPPPPSAPPRAGEFEQAQARLNDILLGMADLRDGQSVLDVGCGFGGTLQSIDTRWSHMDLVGVNIDPRQLEICRLLRTARSNQLEWTQADACRLPFPDASFDRILSVEAMFHFSSRRTFLGEAARLLKPNGGLTVSDIVLQPRTPLPPTTVAAIAAHLDDGYGPWPDVWGSEGDLRSLAAAAGLTCTTEIGATRATFPSHRFTAPSDLTMEDEIPDPTLRAAVTLRWLHEAGQMRYVLMRFVKV